MLDHYARRSEPAVPDPDPRAHASLHSLSFGPVRAMLARRHDFVALYWWIGRRQFSRVIRGALPGGAR